MYRIVSFVILVASAALSWTAPVSASQRVHGLSAFGDLKYPADFKHFDYVNPDAPKGGRLWTVPTIAARTFNHFNAYILKGTAAVGLDLLVDSLMASSGDEPDAMYGLVAESAEVADDKKSVKFYLRPEAKFSDSSPITADDIVFSFDLLKKKGHPNIQAAIADVVSAEALDPHTVEYKFKGEFLRDLPRVVAGLPVLSKAYYTANDFEKETLTPPLTSGPYEIADFRQGSYVTYRRRKDYWGEKLPVNVGRNNFDEIRFDYFAERAASMEAFKSGREHDLREEFSSKSWKTEYNFPAVTAGKVKLLTLPDDTPSAGQGFFINTRRDKFKDVRVRKALDYAFDFEWMNANIFYGMYKRTTSYFENSDMKAVGLPSPEELKLLEPFRAQLSPEVFGEPYVPPVTDGSGEYRPSFRAASKLLDDAGWTIKDGVRKNAKGETLSIEFLIDDASWERIVNPYAQNLKKLGIQVVQRRVDPSQEQELQKNYDFDVNTSRFTLQSTPGPEVRVFWNGQMGKEPGSYNLAGINDPVVDALVEKILHAETRDALRTACRALDRVLRAGHYWVPQWYKASHNIALWDRYGHPDKAPAYDRNSGIYDTWWYDDKKAAQLTQ